MKHEFPLLHGFNWLGPPNSVLMKVEKSVFTSIFLIIKTKISVYLKELTTASPPQSRLCVTTELIITITISSNVTGALADLFFTYHVQLWTDSWLLSDTCNGRVEAYNYTKSTRLDPPITELIKITIATTTHSERKTGQGYFQNRGILFLTLSLPEMFVLNVFFSEIVTVMINW